MASTGIEDAIQDVSIPWSTLGNLPFSLDLTCPIPLPSRSSSGTPWPFSVAGPSTIKDEDFAAYARRRYLETLFLSDLLSPIPHFIEDVSRNPIHLAESIRPLLLTLVEIEKRHRKVILPIISALVGSASNPTSEISTNIVHAALAESSLPKDEQDVIRVAAELRLESRIADDGAVIHARKISDELEKRETLIQVAMLFLYISHALTPGNNDGKKRKREKKKPGTKTVLDDPVIALETLMDRLSVWSAVADLGVGPSQSAGEGFTGVLKAFWNDVLKPHFLSKQPELCASFHLKVFARPISPTIVPSTTKKSRKPAITRARPSSDALTQPESLRAPSRASSRAPSDTARRSPSRDRSLSRSLSTRPDGLELRRSRSNSIDPAKREDSFGQAKKGVMRAPSSKDLFKGRQVGFIRRTSSVVGRKGKERETQSLGLGRTESTVKMGLLGRKTSDPKGRRNSEESQQQSQPGTLIFATPSKPRLADSIFGPRISKFAPTPIQEEPGSVERPAFVTETPHGPGRMSKDVGNTLVTETPMTSTRDFVPGTGTSYAGMAINALNSVERVDDSGDESDPLAELMVMTDEED